MKKTNSVFLARAIIISIITIGSILPISCNKNQTQQNEQLTQETAPVQTPEPGYIRKDFFTRYNTDITNQFSNYYANPIHLSKPAIPHYNRLAVVAGKRALFYPGAKLTQQKDAERLKKAIEIPFGTLLPIFAEIKTQEGSTFFHDDYYHYFYETEYDGKRGLVFGADLFGMDKAPEVTLEAWRLYTTGYGKDLKPFAGLSKLPDAVTGMIEDVGIAYLPVKDATYLSSASTGSLLRAMYETLAVRAESGEDPVPLFITADLIIDAYYEIAANLEHNLLPVIALPLIKQFIQESLTYFSKAKPKEAKIQTIQNKVIYFLQTTELLLNTIPEYIIEFDTYENKDIVKKKIKSKSEIFSHYPEIVQHDAENLLTAEGDWYSEIFETTINTNRSGNNPTDTQSNQTAFIINKILTWLSLASLDINAITHFDSVTFKNRHGTIAWILYLLAGISENQTSMDALASLIQAEHLLQQSHEMIISKDFVQFLKQEKLTPLSTWIYDPAKTLSVIKLIQKKYKASSLSKPDSNFSVPLAVNQEKKILALLLPATRIEEVIFSQVTSPPVPNRNIVSCMDLLNSFDDFSILSLSYVNRFPELKPIYEAQRTSFANSTEANIQNMPEPIRSVLALKQETEINQLYSQTPGWKIKTALTNLTCFSLSIPAPKLAVPQNSPFLTPQPTQHSQKDSLPARIEPLHATTHWLEPRASLYKAMQSTVDLWKIFVHMARLTESSLIADARNKAIDETIAALDNFDKLVATCAQIAQKELSGEKLSSEETVFILHIPQTLAAIIGSMPKTSAYTGASLAVRQENTEGSDTSTVVNEPEEPSLFIPSKRLIYRTKNENGQTELYAGPGVPYIVYIPISLPDGSRFIAAGFVYSYLEFTQSVGNLTETEWQNIVFSDEANMYKLEWE